MSENKNLEKYAQKLNEIFEMKSSNLNMCDNCKLLKICRYCPAKFYLTTRNYEVAPEWYCQFSQAIYNNFINGFRIIKKLSLSQIEIDQVYEIISSNMKKLGILVSDADKLTWCNRLLNQLRVQNHYFYIAYLNGKICGFVELSEIDRKLYVSEFELSDWCKGTKVIIYIIKALVECSDLSQYDKIHFKINKTNLLSTKTFSHLGATKYMENERSASFILNRDVSVDFINKFESIKICNIKMVFKL